MVSPLTEDSPPGDEYHFITAVSQGEYVGHIWMNISVIIPTLNEADRIADVIAKTREAGDCEIIVCDGGSDDETLARATAADQVLNTQRGRATQQNAGAKVSNGDVLLFLHADCWLAPGSFEAIERALADDRIVAGCFRHRIEADGFGYRLIEWGNGFRVRAWGLAYGDQGIFVRRAAWDAVGGFPDVKLMEDLLLMKRLKKRGRIQLLEEQIHVSPRRWQQQGLLRQTLRNWTLLTLANCGVSPNRLARFYPHVR